MEMKVHEKRTYGFLLILTIFSTIVFQLWRTLFNNFGVDTIGLQSDSIGLVQAFREVPGFLALTAVYITLIIKEKWFGFFSAILLSIGVALTGYFPTKWGLVATTVLMSTGFHFYETVNQSLSMQYFSKLNFPSATANLRRYGALAAILTGIAITPLTKLLDFKTLYLIFGILGVLGTLFALKFLPDESKVPVQKKGLVFKKEYKIYYALTFLNGARRQIFTVFALFLLVQRHGMSATTISILFVLNNAINFFIYPQIAKIINRWGEKFTLKLEYLSLIIIFLMYALVDHPWAALALYILDNLSFGFSMATKSYFQKIADSADLAPTAGVSFTINHIAAVIIPYIGGILWLVDWRIPFYMAAFLSLL
ncbi:MAG: MFS transporter, partial [Halobacteriovoraceae bacterium]|nr:MFS transporter [Halobacteriovoraceae bacterium]